MHIDIVQDYLSILLSTIQMHQYPYIILDKLLG